MAAAMSEFEGGVEWLRICLASEGGPIPTTLASRAEGLLRELAAAQAEPSYCTGICPTTTSCPPSVSLGSPSFIGVIDISASTPIAARVLTPKMKISASDRGSYSSPRARGVSWTALRSDSTAMASPRQACSTRLPYRSLSVRLRRSSRIP